MEVKLGTFVALGVKGSRMIDNCSFNLGEFYVKMGKTNRNLLRRIWMKLFLCSHFSSVGSLIKEEFDNKKSHLFQQHRCVKATLVMSARLESYSINWEQP